MCSFIALRMSTIGQCSAQWWLHYQEHRTVSRFFLMMRDLIALLRDDFTEEAADAFLHAVITF